MLGYPMPKTWDNNLTEEQLQIRRDRARIWNTANKFRHAQTQRLHLLRHPIPPRIALTPRALRKVRKQISAAIKKFHEKYPWYWSYASARQRCTNPKNPRFKRYGARGIKFCLTKADMAFMWNRDHATQMSTPSLDRINNNGDYALANCRFIEMSDNCRKQALDNWKKKNGYSISDLLARNSPSTHLRSRADCPLT